MSEEKPVCAMCGVTVPECGSWMQCKIFNGHVCMTCCMNCMHFRELGSHVFCAAAYAQKNDGSAKPSE